MFNLFRRKRIRKSIESCVNDVNDYIYKHHWWRGRVFIEIIHIDFNNSIITCNVCDKKFGGYTTKNVFFDASSFNLLDNLKELVDNFLNKDLAVWANEDTCNESFRHIDWNNVKNKHVLNYYN